MGKKRCWLGFLKRFFVCKAESIDEKGIKNRKWCFGILKMKYNYHALETPKVHVKDHDQEDQKQHTLVLAIAMTAAADAAIAAANAAAKLARLVMLSEDMQRRTQTAAAIKIQSFYRAHLAWKALIGLRGVVNLQAVIRGEIVRQKVLKELKSTQQIKVHQICVPALVQVSKICNNKQDLFSPQNDRRNKQILQDSTVIRTYHRPHQETSIMSYQTCETHKKLRLRHEQHTYEHTLQSFNARSHYHLSAPDRSDDTSLLNSQILPSYMATTESFMAKARSLSTPRQRLSFLDGYYTHGSSFGIPMLSSSSSVNGDMQSSYKTMNL